MFDNAWAYNKKTSRVYKYCSKLSEVFDEHIDGAMMQLGYCCGMRVSRVCPVYILCVWLVMDVCCPTCNLESFTHVFFAYSPVLLGIYSTCLKNGYCE